MIEMGMIKEVILWQENTQKILYHFLNFLWCHKPLWKVGETCFPLYKNTHEFCLGFQEIPSTLEYTHEPHSKIPWPRDEILRGENMNVFLQIAEELLGKKIKIM